MKLIRGLVNLTPFKRGAALSIGNFDGVHLGHQYVLGELAERGESMNIPAGVMIFEPQPLEFFTPDRIPSRLTRFREKIRALARLNLDFAVVIGFNRKFAELPAEAFIRDILIDRLNIKHLVVGDDFRFGYKREGDFAMLQDFGLNFGFQVEAMRGFSLDGERVSSTAIRTSLHEGNLSLGQKMLGRPYRMCGRVSHGKKKGRSIGFPTANISLHRKLSPISGVFVVEMFGLEKSPVKGVANLGTRPTAEGNIPMLEVHLFDFDQDIYDRYVSVDFLHKIRSEKKFPSFSALKARIARDVDSARLYFSSNHP